MKRYRTEKTWFARRRRRQMIQDGSLPVAKLTLAELSALLSAKFKVLLNQEFDELWDKEQEIFKRVEQRGPLGRFWKWCKKYWVRAIAFVFLPATFLIGEGIKFISANVFDAYGVDDIVMNRFDLKKAAHPVIGPCIFGAGGRTAYRDISNRLADFFESAGYPGYGYCRPVDGAVDSVELVANAANPWHVGITQSDVEPILSRHGEIAQVATLFELTNLKECVLVPSSTEFVSFDDLVRASHAATEGRRSPLRIALRQKGSGGYVTGWHVLRQTMKPTGYQVTYYFDNNAVAQAVAAGIADAGVVVEFPGRVKHEFHAAMKTIDEHHLNLLGMEEAGYRRHFSDEATGYRLMKVHVQGEWSFGFRWPPVTHYGEKKLPAMLCTSSVNVVGYDPAYIEDPRVRRNIEDRNTYLTKKILPEGFRVSDNLQFTVIAMPGPMP